MAKTECRPEEYRSSGGRCCARCPAGKYIRSDCDSNKPTECVQCERGRYTATVNSLRECYDCLECNHSNKKWTEKACMADEDTVCACITGFYCGDDSCEHCQPVTRCPVGHGVKVKATRTTNTVCAACEMGTYSNVSDFQSSCQTHTRCVDLGRVQTIPGTTTSDASCGDFKSHCPWMLPAGLWSGFAGFVLTCLILLVIVCWLAKRRSRRAGSYSVPAPPACVYPIELPLPITELNGHCQERCSEKEYQATLFQQVDSVVSCCTPQSLDSISPCMPLMTSVSISESNHINGKAGNGTSSSLPAHSEPQEDEWCGT
ncbi:tumor necrosis factor receptor superfamily member 5 [Genypterus blacodes]|uniref:tumor necrosis factor receptor superfamily member 5 n=1 Tax=Genypterus blacodes TaxID=154954 RepID=UPI003F772B05